MAEPRKPNLTLLIFDSLAAPVIIFNVAGDVSYANPVALALEGQPAQNLKKNPQIQAIVRDILMGKLSLPASMDIAIDIENAHVISGVFVRGPSAVDVVFLPEVKELAGSKEASNKSFDVDGTIKLIRQELIPPVEDLSKKLRSLDHVNEAQEVQLSLKDLQNRLDRLVDLTQVFGDELTTFEDFLAMPEIVQTVCRGLKPTADKFQIQLQIEGANRELPQIYGNYRLIHRAIYEMVHHTMLTLREGVMYKEWMQVKLSLMSTGSFLSIGVHSMGAIARPDVVRSPTGAASPVNAEIQMGERIGVPMVRRIIELHGGTLKITNDEVRGSFVLFEFPTGSPIKPSAELHMLQAKAYAADLSKLFERMRKSQK